MYSKHCHFIPEDGGDMIHSEKLIHLPAINTHVSIKPKSTGVTTEYLIEKVTLVLEEVTLSYPGPPASSNDNWEYKWDIEVSEVV